MKPDTQEDFENDFAIIDASLDPFIFPEGIMPDQNALPPDESGYVDDDGYVDNDGYATYDDDPDTSRKAFWDPD